MLKIGIQNKELTGGQPLVTAELYGKHANRDEVVAAREDALEKLARERDPVEANKLAIIVAQLNSALDAFDNIDKAKMQGQFKRLEIYKSDMKTAAEGRTNFRSHCDVIAAKVLGKAGIRRPVFPSDGEDREWRSWANGYLKKLYDSLDYDSAEKQFNEMCSASRERREWLDVVGLPKPRTLPVAGGRG